MRGRGPDDSTPGERTPARDAGFTFLELLIALTILLITVMAVTGVMMASMYMTSAARQKSAMVNAAAGYLERMRQEPYAHIGVPGGDPGGDLATVTVMSGIYTLTVTPQVTWGRPEDPSNRAFKTVTVTVVSAGGGGAAGRYRSSAIIGESGDVTPIDVVETTPTCAVVAPQAGSALWGSNASLVVSATSDSPVRTLSSLGLYDGTTVIGLTVASGLTASATFAWNTIGVREGIHTLTPTVSDTRGTIIQGARTDFLIDNLAPGAPISPGLAIPDGSTAQVWWTGSTDGTQGDGTTPQPSDHYVTAAWQQPSSAALAADYTQWTALPALSRSVVSVPTSSTPLALSGLPGFNRFAVTVRASSPDRGAAGGLLSAPTVLTGITQSTLTGTWTATRSGNRYTVAVALGVPAGPGFAWNGSATTSFYRLTSATQAVTSGTLLRTVVSSNPTWAGVTASDTQTTASNGTPTAYWYGAVTTITPLGYGASSTAVQSSVVGPPASTTATGAQPMVFARW